jgi:hypothetical protein
MHMKHKIEIDSKNAFTQAWRFKTLDLFLISYRQALKASENRPPTPGARHFPT